MEEQNKNPIMLSWKKNDEFLEDTVFEDSEGEYRYNPDKNSYEYYPDWLGYTQSENDFWETV